tara:strand:+ start:84 stop:743 length:660 start_codon:yes stop_codon:yes gene_type:complete
MKKYNELLTETQQEFINVFGLSFNEKTTKSSYKEMLQEHGITKYLKTKWNRDSLRELIAIADTLYIAAQFSVLSGIKIEAIDDSSKMRDSIDTVVSKVINDALPINNLIYILIHRVSNFTPEQILKAYKIIHSTNMQKAHDNFHDAVETFNSSKIPCIIECVGEDFNNFEIITDVEDRPKQPCIWYVVKHVGTSKTPFKVVAPNNWIPPRISIQSECFN